MGTTLIPQMDAAGLPGPAWLFHVLLVFTFFLHMVFMNLTLGGTILAWVAHLRAGRRRDDPNRVLADRMIGINTFGISLTITTGVAPLLFVQILYQQFFYAGTILLGWIWFALILLLMAGYYATYLYKFKGAPRRGAGGGFWLAASAVAFLLVAMIHVAAHLIHTQPDLWAGLAARPWSVLADRTYWPRLLHFVVAGIAFSALVITWWSARRAGEGQDVEVNRAIARSCWKWALWATVLAVADGFVLLALLPREVLLGIMRGGPATLVPLTLSLLLGIGLLVMLSRSIDPVARRPLVSGSLATVALAVAVMAVTRHQVRMFYLDPATSGFTPRIEPQWGVFALFVACLIVALGTVAYMTTRVLRDRATGSEAA